MLCSLPYSSSRPSYTPRYASSSFVIVAGLSICNLGLRLQGFHGIRTKIKHSQQKLIIESISRLVLIIRPFFLLT
ncbi:hypothetical protein HanPSC8_Chr12g0504231 [Helianthus annuus]|nr:hypothetical protein HanPSC8_Chr12g0504231 [Helianthus annuus]